LLTRYTHLPNGKRSKVADIYTAKEHGINPAAVSEEAYKVLNRLKNSNCKAYIVGGAVRDLIIGNSPKDFDIVTDALPKKVRKLFWNSRIIGRRFRLVHITFKNTMIEVSTFRSDANNSFGTIEEDVKRRDFSINSLYYDPFKGFVLDFNNAMKDIRKRRLRSLLPLETTFQEDPVRILRAIKYAASGGFKIPWKLGRKIRHEAHRLETVSSSRMTEEFFKILQSGKTAAILKMALDFSVFEYLYPQIWDYIRQNKKAISQFIEKLETLDTFVQEETSERREKLLLIFLETFLSKPETAEDSKALFKEAKILIRPTTPPNIIIEEMVKLYLRKNGILPKKRPQKTVKSKRGYRPRKRSKKPETQQF
jgi:poly(A) polymerase